MLSGPQKKVTRSIMYNGAEAFMKLYFDVVLKTAKETSDIWKDFVKSPRNLRCKNSQIQLHNDLAPL